MEIRFAIHVQNCKHIPLMPSQPATSSSTAKRPIISSWYRVVVKKTHRDSKISMLTLPVQWRTHIRAWQHCNRHKNLKTAKVHTEPYVVEIGHEQPREEFKCYMISCGECAEEEIGAYGQATDIKFACHSKLQRSWFSRNPRQADLHASLMDLVKKIFVSQLRSRSKSWTHWRHQIIRLVGTSSDHPLAYGIRTSVYPLVLWVAVELVWTIINIYIYIYVINLEYITSI